MPVTLRSEVADILGQGALVPIAVLRTRRAGRRLLAADGTLLLLIADDLVEATVLLGGERILRWRELEVELVEGHVSTLDAMSARLVESGLAPAAGPSKLGRAMAEVLAELARPGEPTAGRVALAYLAQELGVLQALEHAVREDAPDAVHKSRWPPVGCAARCGRSGHCSTDR